MPNTPDIATLQARLTDLENRVQELETFKTSILDEKRRVREFAAWREKHLAEKSARLRAQSDANPQHGQ
jgi:hypothetical protein